MSNKPNATLAQIRAFAAQRQIAYTKTKTLTAKRVRALTELFKLCNQHKYATCITDYMRQRINELAEAILPPPTGSKQSYWNSKIKSLLS